MKFVFDKVFLRYPKEGEPGLSGCPTHADDAEKFVALDSASGGYPYATSVDQAHDFKTVAEAEKYRSHFDQLIVCEVRVTFDLMCV